MTSQHAKGLRTMGRPRDAKARQRAAQAVSLRAEGYTYEEIAEKLRYSDRASAFNAVNTLMQRQEAENVDALRVVAGARYEQVIANMMQVLQEATVVTETIDDGEFTRTEHTHDVPDRVRAARTIIRAQDSLNRLFGLNSEPNARTSRPNLLVVEAETLSNKMAAELAPQQEQVDLGEIIDVIVEDE